MCHRKSGRLGLQASKRRGLVEGRAAADPGCRPRAKRRTDATEAAPPRGRVGAWTRAHPRSSHAWRSSACGCSCERPSVGNRHILAAGGRAGRARPSGMLVFGFPW
eukprot:3725175-Prymnesium_polylepis.1